MQSTYVIIRIIITHLSLLLCNISSEETFTRFCLNAGRHGEGTLQNSYTCVIKYPAPTSNEEEAEEFCRANSPFALESFRYGEPTKCIHVKEYSCEENEEEVMGKCFALAESKGKPFSRDACPPEYTLHVLESREEFQWIAVSFRQAKRVWVGNFGANARFLKPTDFKKQRRRRDNEKPIFIRLKESANPSERRGHAYYGQTNLQIPYLCSRQAEPFAETLAHNREYLEDIGITSAFMEGKDGNRLFASFNIRFAVEAKQFQANFEKIHEACNVFGKGFPVSRDDFLTRDEFAAVLKKIGLTLARVSVGRAPSFTMMPDKACKKEKYFRTNRKKWSYYDKNGTTFVVADDHWMSGYPDNMCSDTPRITVGMASSGYIDIPAIARKSIICLIGDNKDGGAKGPRTGARQRGEYCNKAARYNKKLKRCECLDPKSDGRVVDPETYGHYPPGVVCMSCATSEKKRSILFLLDGSGTLGNEGWRKELEFISTISKGVGNARTAVLFTGRDEEMVTAMAFGRHSKADLENFCNEYRDDFPHGWTFVGAGMRMARRMLKKETAEDRILMIFSDGETDNKNGGDEYENLKRKQVVEAEAIRKAGIRIIYIYVATHDEFLANARNVGGSGFVYVGDYNNLRKFAGETLKKVCTPVV